MEAPELGFGLHGAPAERKDQESSKQTREMETLMLVQGGLLNI